MNLRDIIVAYTSICSLRLRGSEANKSDPQENYFSNSDWTSSEMERAPRLHLLDAVDLVVLRQVTLDACDGAVALQNLREIY